MNDKKKKIRWLSFGLGFFQLFISLGAIAGGLGLILEPDGSNLGFSVELLNNSPFSDYLIPGIVLFVFIGIGNLVGGIVSFMRYKYAGEIAAVLGFALIIWIVVELFWIDPFWLHPLYSIFGCVELALGFLLRRSLPTVF
jgi:hypothetical protein